MVSDPGKRIAELQGKLPDVWGPPPLDALDAESTLLEAGLLCVLARHLKGPQARKSAKALRGAYSDWNELRVSQIQEFRGLVATKSLSLQEEVARDVKAYLQEVFQQNHGYDLEFLREDPNEAGKFVLQLPHLGASAAHFVLWVASNGQVPVSSGIVRVLDRLGVMRRTSSMRKAQQALEGLVPEQRRAEFGLRFGQVVESYCDSKKPVCWECVLVEECPHGLKVRRDWRVQQQRIAVQREREDERRRKEEVRLHKRAEAEEKRRAKMVAREEARRERAEAVKKKAEQKRKLAAHRKATQDAKRRAEQQAKRKAEEKRKKELARKKAAAKKAAVKQKAKKKPSKKKPAAKKSPARKKATKKKPAAKKPAVKKKPAKKKSAKKRGRSRR